LSSQISKYRILERIGQGAMGEVFRAHDPVLDRHVALKIIGAGDDERRQRFHREAQSAARLAHPNIVVVHDFGEDTGRFFMAMELLDGIDLKTAIAISSLPTVDQKLGVMEQVCDALAFAHARSIVHRDLKPANIFLLDGQRVKILDFGLARIEQSDMTGTGMILGTPNYMAPEQIEGAKVDARADVFALCAVFYELLGGRKAFDADSLHAVLYKVLRYEPEPLRVAGLPLDLSDLVQKALSKDPDRRYQGALVMRDAIRLLRGVATPSLTITRPAASTGGGTGKPVSGTVVLRSEELDALAPQLTLAGETGGDVQIGVRANQTLLQASLGAHIPHANECGGNARCSTCRVLVLDGAQNLSPRDSAELKLARRLGFGDDIRLACQTKVRGPVRVRRLILDADDVRIASAEKESPTAGTDTPLAVVYASIREFSTLLRRALAYDVVHILNRYHLQVGEAVLSNGGHLDRSSGGSLLALFGVNGEDAVTKCTNAIRAALRMQKRMQIFNKYLQEHFGLTFTLDVGVHYGRMIVGHIGHPDHARLTAVGEPAAIAEAVAEINPSLDTNVLATEELINIVGGSVACGAASHETLAGQREYTLYEVLDFARPDTHYLVQSSWESIVGRREEAARVFYSRLFEIAPAVRPMFAHVDIRTQGAMLMNMITAAVRGLDRLDELKPTLQDLGRRHASYGVQVAHYAPVEECLLHTVEVMMGSDYNLDVKLAWTQIYNFIAATMIEATE
jgi:class 3 adenylate cyclase/hemoglobin-like flavoprotein/predicted Ser/Thr protein kinase